MVGKSKANHAFFDVLLKFRILPVPFLEKELNKLRLYFTTANLLFVYIIGAPACGLLQGGSQVVNFKIYIFYSTFLNTSWDFFLQWPTLENLPYPNGLADRL